MVLGLLVRTAAGIPVLASHLIAAVLALLLLEGLSALAERLLGKPALGLGDAKLAALGGSWLGPREPFPFGPFIALGIWLV